MFQTGSQINPSLGRTDYSAYAQGAIAGGQAIGQGIANLGQGLASGIEQYAKQKKENKQLEANLKGSIVALEGLGPTAKSISPEAYAYYTGLMAKLNDPAISTAEKVSIGNASQGALRDIISYNLQEKTKADQDRSAEAALFLSGSGSGPIPVENRANVLKGRGFTNTQIAAGTRLSQEDEKSRLDLEKRRLDLSESQNQIKLNKEGALALQAINRFGDGLVARSTVSPEGYAIGKNLFIDQQLKQQKLMGGGDTAAIVNSNSVIRDEITSGKLDPNDPVAIAKRRAELVAGGGQDQSAKFGYPIAYVDKNGSFVGHFALNNNTAQFERFNPATGKMEPPPEGSQPSTVSGLYRGALSGPQFQTLRENFYSTEAGLTKLSNYLSNVETAGQGLDLLSDEFSRKLTTILSSGQLSEQQMAAAKSEAELQGLLGSIRLQTLGGGVLTEQDATRLIARLGGERGGLKSILANKEVVRAAIGDLYREKYNTYNRQLEDYNIQVKNFYGDQNYKPAAAIEFDDRFKLEIRPRVSASREKELLAKKAALEAKQNATPNR